MSLMDELKKMSDEQLVIEYRGGVKEAADILVKKYKNLVRKNARPFFLTGADNEDLLQEGMIGLYKAIRDYDGSKDVVFMSFASICISRQLRTAITANNRQKNIPLNSYVSFEEQVTDAEGTSARLGDVIADKEDGNPETAVINREQADALFNNLYSDLSKLEKEVLELFLEGLSYLEIAKLLGKNEKSIDNTIQRIRKKISGKMG